ncbi:IclR family transcriptional regulator [Maritimibacter alkaliphilus]|uniref:IclR family transcriptional regulator n=1 Tax=Maritimibacter alkaliphilus TaxID=404236 RepID=UPI001C976E51|nr:IclR family transcriptional regulator [Maritimibacter alkaliphilus]MBY6092604.1 IclR family transcriptional regulator [Maritimibacter alkaliphilus]
MDANRNTGANAMLGVGRAIAVLRLVGSAPEPGLRLRDISEALDLHKTSTSRMLATLMNLGVVERDRNRCYRVSDDFRASFGTPLTTTRLRQAARPALGMLSERLEDVAFLSVPAGLDSLCVSRHIGTYPIQALSLNVGGRRPLGVGAGSLALLAFAPDGEREDLIEMQRDRLGNYRCTVEEIAAAVEVARGQGFTDLPGFVVQGMTGMGIPLRDPSGVVVGALSVAAITDRLTGSRRDMAITALHDAAAMVERRFREGAAQSGGWPSHDGEETA